jgi:hypothetical protein
MKFYSICVGLLQIIRYRCSWLIHERVDSYIHDILILHQKAPARFEMTEVKRPLVLISKKESSSSQRRGYTKLQAGTPEDTVLRCQRPIILGRKVAESKEDEQNRNVHQSQQS